MSVPPFSIEFQGNLVKAKVKAGQKQGGGIRSTIANFSKASRKRLLELVSRMTIKSKVVFLTLTYPEQYPDGHTVKKQLKAMLRWLRSKSPLLSGIWRMEFQERGAPHFHIILFNCPFIDKTEIQNKWSTIIGHERTFTRIEMIRSAKKAFSYVAKYVAKMPEFERKGVHNGDVNQTVEYDESAPVTSGFNHNAYWNGRFWGYLGKENLPYAELKVIEGFIDKPFMRFKWCAEKVYRVTVEHRKWVGFTVFRPSKAWHTLARKLCLDDLSFVLGIEGAIVTLPSR